ncbi:F-box/LRR-repeat protein 15-like protein [Tanacetum coccineum]
MNVTNDGTVGDVGCFPSLHVYTFLVDWLVCALLPHHIGADSLHPYSYKEDGEHSYRLLNSLMRPFSRQRGIAIAPTDSLSRRSIKSEFVMAANKVDDVIEEEVDLNLCLGGQGTASEPQGKRPKVASFALDCDSLFPSAPSLESRPISMTERMPNSSGHYVCSISDDDGSLFISDSSKMEVDENVSQEMDDQEIQMDLTDDLLHLVLSFLDHDNLCRAAKVCRQWRVASAHEDFWRSLNFENRNISPQQYERVHMLWNRSIFYLDEAEYVIACSFMLCDLDFEPLSLSLSFMPSCDLVSFTNILILCLILKASNQSLRKSLSLNLELS